MDSSEISSDLSSDLSSQQLLVNQLKEKLQQNESVLKGRESEYNQLQSKFNKLRFLHKSKTSTATTTAASTDSTPTKSGSPENRMTVSTTEAIPQTTSSDSTNRAKVLLLKKQLDESRALLQKQETENQLMKRELQELKDRQIQSEVDKDVEVISTNESTGAENVNQMFAQIVYKDTKIMEMNQRICDLETRIMDLQENLKEQNEVLHARNRAIKVLLSQQESAGSLNVSFDEVVQREEEKERIEKLKERVCELEMEKGNLQLRLMELEGTNGSKPPLIDIELERDSLCAERDELKVRCDELLAKLDSIELQKDRVLTEKERAVNELKKLKDINNGLNKERDKQNTEIDRLTQTNCLFEHNYSSVNNELNALKAEMNEKHNEIHVVRQQLSDLAIKSKTIIGQKDTLISELTEQLTQKSDNNNVLSEKEKLITELNKELQNLKNENWSLVNINEDIKSQYNQIEEQLTNIRTEYETQKQSFDQLVTDKDVVESERQTLTQEFNSEIQVLRNHNSELKTQLDSSVEQLSELQQKFNDYSNRYQLEINELINEIQKLQEINRQLENNSNERTLELENRIKAMTEESYDIINEKTALLRQLEEMETNLETEKQQKSEALEMMTKIQSEKYAENDVIEEKDKLIQSLRLDLEKNKAIIDEYKTKTDDYVKEQEESSSFIKELETDLEDRIRAFDELKINSEENHRLLNDKIVLIDEMNEQKQDLETKFEEAKLKNQTLATQMENLIKIVEFESQEKERLKQSLENLQKENFDESDLIREKDSRIESLQKEIRKQVEDMQEVEELLNEKQTEMEALNDSIVSINKEKIELQNKTDELTKKLVSSETGANEEITELQRQIEDLNEEIDSNKSEIKSMNRKLSDDLKAANQRFETREEENLSTIAELRKQLESQEIKLTEAMNELMIKSDENTDTNLLHNEIQTLRQTIESLQHSNQVLQNDYQKSVSQSNASVVEYKSLLDEARIQIDRLEAEKLSAVQETNKVNQVLETERHNQTSIASLNDNLRQRISQLETDLESVRTQNQYESVQNESINNLNQTIDDLRKHNTELSSELDELKQISDDSQHSNTQELNDLRQKAENERSELNQRLSELQTTVEKITGEKQQFEYAYYDMQNRFQEFEQRMQNKNFEIENLKQLENSYKQITEALNNMRAEKEHLLAILAEKDKTVEQHNQEKQRLLEEKQLIDQTLKDKEQNISELNSQIEKLNEINKNLENNSNQTVVTYGDENEMKTRITELEEEVEQLKTLHNESDAKTSEAEYELDILKRNYSLEMESFGAQVQERETIVEKLQDRNDKLKRKVEKLNASVKDFTEKEAYFKSKLEESDGMIKYEQMQRQSATDSRIFELQNQLKDKENDYGMELMNLRADISNLSASEQQLKQRIHDMEQTQTQAVSKEEYEREVGNYRTHIESLINQLESERIEKKRIQDLFQSSSGQNTDQMNQILAQMEAERQQLIAQKQDIELKCKRFAAKFKVKEREVNTLEEKLRIAKENASKNVNEEELIDSTKRIEELVKKVEDLQFTASNLDSALQTERQRRRELENEKQTFWSQSSKVSNLSAIDGDRGSTSGTSFSLLIDEGNGDKSHMSSAKRFISKQKHFLLRGPPNAKYKRIAIVVYLVVIHILFVKACLF